MGSLARDVSKAGQRLLRNPGFALSVVLSLGIGVGANSAVFAVANALLLRPLPYPDEDRLALLWSRSPGIGIGEDWFSTAQYFDIKTAQTSLQEVAIAIGANANLTGDGAAPERVGTLRVSANLLPMFGARALLGRLLGPADEQPGVTGTAVLGHAAWLRRFGGDPAAVGRLLVLNGEAYQVVGVLDPAFDLPREVLPTLGGAEHADVVVPLPLDAGAAQVRNREDYNIVAKLAPGVGLERAQAELDALTARLRQEHPSLYPANGGLTFDLVPLREQVVGDTRTALRVLLAAVALVLLVACLNVANLLLARAASRQRDVAVRAALGATRGQLLRELLAESLLLALAGGALGLLLCGAGLRALLLLGSRSVPRLHEIGLGADVFAFVVLLSLASTVLFGWGPAWRLSRPDLQAGLSEGRRGSSGPATIWSRRDRTRRLLVAAELALCVVVLVAASLLVRSFGRVRQVPPGFNPASVLTFELTLTGRQYAEAPVVLETYRQLFARLGALPGVSAAGAVSALPLSQMMAWGPLTVEGRTPQPGEAFINADIRVVGGDYFRALEIPLLSGRLFDEHDTRGKDRVVVVDAALAEQLWPGQDPLGKRLRSGGIDAQDAPWLTVVGVVGRIQQDRLDAASRIALYHPHTQYPARGMNVALRSRVEPLALLDAVRREVRAIDPDLPIYGQRTMTQRVDESLGRRRFSMLLLSLFAVLALVLGLVGTYGVISYEVSQGTRELGIRLALGATPGRVLREVLGQGLTLAAAGVGAGLLGAFALAGAMRSLLFGVGAGDPVTFLGVPALLVLATLAAVYGPARRAARVDPASSLRSE